MRKILQLFIVALVAFSCGSNGNVNKSKGELVGVKGNKYYAEKPFGMVLVPGGSFIMGKSDDDMPSIQDAPTKTVTVRSFYMDETEITNAEYRQFVRWVRDSVIRTALAEQFRDRDDIGPESEYFQYLYKSEKASKESDDESDWDGKTDLDWDVDLDYLDLLMEITNHHTQEIRSFSIVTVNMQKLLEGFYLMKIRFSTTWFFLGR